MGPWTGLGWFVVLLVLGQDLWTVSVVGSGSGSLAKRKTATDRDLWSSSAMVPGSLAESLTYLGFAGWWAE